jgi:hypothetical protein
VLGSGGTGISGSSDIVATIQWEIQNSAVSTQVAVAHDPKDPQPVNHAILTFQPTPSIPLLQQYIISVPYLDAYSSICFPVMARIREILYCFFFSSSCLVSEWHHSYTRESDAAHSAAKAPQKCQFHHQGPASSIILFRGCVSFQQQ